MREFQNAWKLRVDQGDFENTEALRIFYGPTEGSGFLSNIAIDQFGAHAWVTEWESAEVSLSEVERQKKIEEIILFLKTKKFESAVALFRPEKNIPAEPTVLFGSPPSGRFEMKELGAKYWIQLLEVKHPGLFLDHAPLRSWLMKNMKGMKVLNTFAYTGSLSIAAASGGAVHVTTLDLSKPTTEWGKANWDLNGFPKENSDFIFGDYFEWLPKMIRRAQKFDCVILDPPSFSRGVKGNFSTSKDLVKLHDLAIEVLEPEGILITSLNSANVSRKKYWSEIQEAAHSKKVKFKILEEIKLPSSFPIPKESEPYLKGWILKRL